MAGRKTQRRESETGRPVVLVTGASGLIGSRLCERLSRRFDILALDRGRPRRELPGTTLIECDLTRDASVEDAFWHVRQHTRSLASAVHLAAYYDFSGAPSPLYDELTVQGTARVLRELARLDRVEQLVFSSTLLVMRDAEPGQVIDERSPLDPTWDYPRSKLETERLIERRRGAIPAVILRIAGVYDDDTHSIPLAEQMHRIRERTLESYFFPGDADRGQPFVHLDDLVDAFERVIDARGKLDPLEVFLIAEPDIVTYRELQEILGEELHGREWPSIRIPAPLAKAGAWIKEKLPGEDFIKPWMIDLADAHYPVSIEHARRALGWSPRKRLRDRLRVMTARLRADPARWYAENHPEPPKDVERESARERGVALERRERGAAGA